jgi:uncharacterized protein (TIGR00255 family)
VQASLTFEPQEGTRALRIDPAALAAAVRIAKEIESETGLAPARVDGLLALKGVLVQDDVLPLSVEERAARDAAILDTLATAFHKLARARAAEGAKLELVLSAQISEIARLTDEAAKLAAAQPHAIRERLLLQVRELTASGSFSDERLAQEVALLAARADVREELDRLHAHAAEARALIGSTDPVGRKLDFLAQEFNREANTLCSKSSDIRLTRVGLSLKAVIDQFREQAQNVE